MYEHSAITDALGRTIKTTDRLSDDDADDVTMRYLYDIQGNLKLVTDALGRVAFSYVYDLKPKAGEEDSGANVLWMEHIDSGVKTAVFDAAFKNIELKDAKGSWILNPLSSSFATRMCEIAVFNG
jgi:YD repeat-containing protein